MDVRKSFRYTELFFFSNESRFLIQKVNKINLTFSTNKKRERKFRGFEKLIMKLQDLVKKILYLLHGIVINSILYI